MRSLIESLRTASVLAEEYFTSRQQESGSYGEAVTGIACYYKHAMMYLVMGKNANAKKTLEYIKTNFLRENGDFFLQGADEKSKSGAYNEFYAVPFRRASKACKLNQK